MLDLLRQIYAFMEIAWKREKMRKILLVTLLSVPFFLLTFWAKEEFNYSMESIDVYPLVILSFVFGFSSGINLFSEFKEGKLKELLILPISPISILFGNFCYFIVTIAIRFSFIFLFLLFVLNFQIFKFLLVVICSLFTSFFSYLLGSVISLSLRENSKLVGSYILLFTLATVPFSIGLKYPNLRFLSYLSPLTYLLPLFNTIFHEPSILSPYLSLTIVTIGMFVFILFISREILRLEI